MNELSGRVERVEALDASMQADMFALYARYYGGTSKALFLGDLADKQYAVILRDGHGTLQGFSSIKVWEECVAGRRLRVMYSGDTIVHQDHWGQQALAFTWIDFSGALKADAPALPLYWLLLVKGHRTYRYLRAFYRVFYPALQRETPPETKSLMDHLAAERSEEHTSELQSLMRISYAVFCLKKKHTIVSHTKKHNTAIRHNISINYR